VPPNDNPFPHLPFSVVYADRARLHGGGQPGRRELAIKGQVAQHFAKMNTAVTSLQTKWTRIAQQRDALNLPALPPDKPLLILVEEDTDLDFLRSAFDFEIISEEEGGFVLAATRDTDFAQLKAKLELFRQNLHGGASTARLYEILDLETSEQRLARVLTDSLLRNWPAISDDASLLVDISLSCVGNSKMPDLDPIADDEKEEHYQKRLESHLAKRQEIIASIDDIQRERETEIERFIATYRGTIVQMTQAPDDSIFKLPDSFTVRAEISGKCFKDLAQNHPHVFRIEEKEEVDSAAFQQAQEQQQPPPEIVPPREDAPSVCVIDSGMQEAHPLLRAAVVVAESRCFLPDASLTDTADYFPQVGHGTGVAGSVLYPRDLPAAGSRVQLPCWLHNARVLDDQCNLPKKLMPALYLSRVVAHYTAPNRPHRARLFNHSVGSRLPYYKTHMSTWAAAIDKLSHEYDILVVQSAGNINTPDVAAHLAAGVPYPDYLLADSSRIRNPGQSLAALTVGSVAHTHWHNGFRTSIANAEKPSAFSAAGEGIWGSIKPDVVEYGGDYVAEDTTPPRVTCTSAVSQPMVCSTMHGSPATGREAVGTSFSAPKVSHIAAQLAAALPDEPCQLYRALIANSARWPKWAEESKNKRDVLRQIGYGIPDLTRATTNDDYRVTLISSGQRSIAAREAHIYHIPVPRELRAPELDCTIRIDVTLAYTALPRRTRRRVQGYLAARLDWDVSKIGESVQTFSQRIFFDREKLPKTKGTIFSWMLRDNIDHGVIEGVSRQNSTLQKDWCYIRSHELPPDFCIAVVGHPGWDPSPASKANYAVVVSFEAVNQDLHIYQPISVAVETQVPVPVRERVVIPAEPVSDLFNL
jgi:hypothetical protein